MSSSTTVCLRVGEIVILKKSVQWEKHGQKLFVGWQKLGMLFRIIMFVYYSHGRCFGNCITRFKRYANHWMFDLAKISAKVWPNATFLGMGPAQSIGGNPLSFPSLSRYEASPINWWESANIIKSYASTPLVTSRMKPIEQVLGCISVGNSIRMGTFPS